MSSVNKLIVLRHGQSQWNLENRFTGWADVDLTKKGRQEATRAGEQMLAADLKPQMLFTSLQKRAIRTAWLALDVMERMWLPVKRSWRLNERSYGALQGLNKAETAEKYGQEQVHLWRRSFDVPPPALSLDDSRHPKFDARYQSINVENLPASECLKDTVERIKPFWHESIQPQIIADQTVLIVAHGNSLRALAMMLENISEQEIVKLNIPTGAPLVYDLDEQFNVLKREYLGDPAAIAAAEAEVKAQAQGKS